ncbi:hypothetical protein H257_05394 [Aphanomyces astaci]|uniref:Uncharacterized protein n=1 Tax=Aphanomyces astaci TaxID=112090 RepID=W4GR60_APHAT|nr:hypothetical protein H257_05394 [Aphanomyces astaci]ETV81826.1 hypothetical protein H257_05394 [Aphanomyces astaci]|eukprot:XP_009828563.1 hypothetical protein H257_05394 [Aphanomyces astaci]
MDEGGEDRGEEHGEEHGEERVEDLPPEKKDEVKSIPALRAQLDDVQARYRHKEPELLNELNNTYDYMVKNLDPIMSEALEDLMLHRPEQVAAYLAFYMAGTVDVSKYKKTQLQPQAYFERKVQPALGLAVDSVIRDKPDDVKAYLMTFFDQRANIY